MVLLASERNNNFRQCGVNLKIKDILIDGGRLVFYNQKFVLILWVTNALFSLILTIPIYLLLTVNIGHSLISNLLNQTIDYVWLLQFRHQFSIELSQIPILLYGVILIYILLNTFYSGGLLSVFNQPVKNHVIDFFYGGVKYWFRFFKVLLISIILYLIIFSLYEITGRLNALLFGSQAGYYGDFIFRLVRYIVLLFFIGIVTVITDYARVLMVVKNNVNVTESILNSTKFIFKNFNKVFSVFLTVALLGATGAILYNFAGLFIPKSPFYFLLLTFILQQILIIFRLNIRMFFFSTEITLYKDLNAELIGGHDIKTEGV